MIPEIPTFYIDVIRSIVGVLVFGYAAYHDYNSRYIPDISWNVIVIVGAVLFSVQILSSTSPLQLVSHYAANIVLAIIVGWGMYLSGLFGGADTKAITAVAVLFPAVPYFGATTIPVLSQVYSIPLYAPTVAPPYDIVLPATIITFLSNTAIFGIVYPIALGLRSVTQGIDETQRLNSLLADRVEIDELLTYHGVIVDQNIYPKISDSNSNSAGSSRIIYKLFSPLLKYRQGTNDGLPAEFFRDYMSWYTEKYDEDATIQTVEWKLREFISDYNEKHEQEYQINFDQNTLADDMDDVEESLLKLQDQENVFATPGFPVIVPMFFALLAMVTIGDVIFALMTLLN